MMPRLLILPDFILFLSLILSLLPNPCVFPCPLPSPQTKRVWWRYLGRPLQYQTDQGESLPPELIRTKARCQTRVVFGTLLWWSWLKFPKGWVSLTSQIKLTKDIRVAVVQRNAKSHMPPQAIPGYVILLYCSRHSLCNSFTWDNWALCQGGILQRFVSHLTF